MRLHYTTPRISGFLFFPAGYLIYTFFWCSVELYDMVVLLRHPTAVMPFQIVSVYIWLVAVHLLLTIIVSLFFFKKKRGTVVCMVFFLLVKIGLSLVTLTYALPSVIANVAICLMLMVYFLSSPLPRRVFTR